MSLTINSLWIGRRLGEVHAACLKSFVDKGYDVVLHSYGRPEDTPKGVAIFDANKLMQETEIVRFSTGNLALASDKYRYRILKEGLGLYVDCDVYCVNRLDDSDYMLGWEDQSTINGAVLKVPHNSILLQQLMDAAEDPYFIPPWLKKNRILKYKIRRRLGLAKAVSHQPWGTIGPLLISHLVKENGLQEKASPIDVFYPVHHRCTSLFYERGLKLQDLITPRTTALHLYNTAMQSTSVIPDSPMYEILNS